LKKKIAFRRSKLICVSWLETSSLQEAASLWCKSFDQ